MRASASQRSDRPWRALYKTARWLAIAKHQLRTHPLCAYCSEQGRIVVARACDHIEPHRGDRVKFFAGPFQSLCWSCHSGKKQHIETRGYSNEIDAQGNYLDAQHPQNRGEDKNNPEPTLGTGRGDSNSLSDIFLRKSTRFNEDFLHGKR